MRRMFLVLIAASLLAVPQLPACPPPALLFSGGIPFPYVTDPAPNTVGWMFYLSAPVTVNSLGFYEFGHGGLLVDHQVAIWDFATQNMMVSAVVPSGPGPTAWDFKWTSVPLVTLPAGLYVIGAEVAVNGVADDLYMNQASSILTFDGVAYQGGFYRTGGFGYPSEWDPLPGGDFGPNFQVTPEPGTFILLGTGILGLAGILRHKLPI